MFLAGIARSVLTSALSQGSQALGKASSALSSGASKVNKGPVSPHKDSYNKPSHGAPLAYGKSGEPKHSQKAEAAETAASATPAADGDGDKDKTPMSTGSKVMMGLGAVGSLVGLGGLSGAFGGSGEDKEG